MGYSCLGQAGLTPEPVQEMFRPCGCWSQPGCAGSGGPWVTQSTKVIRADISSVAPNKIASFLRIIYAKAVDCGNNGPGKSNAFSTAKNICKFKQRTRLLHSRNLALW